MCRFYGVTERYLLDEIDYVLFEVKARDMLIIQLQEQLSHAYTSNASPEYVKKLKYNLEFLEGSNQEADVTALKKWKGRY